MPTQFNGLCLEKAEIAELNTLEINYGKLKDKTKEEILDKERRNKLSQKKKWGDHTHTQMIKCKLIYTMLFVVICVTYFQQYILENKLLSFLN